MNVDIKNFGHYRVTSHGGRSYDLFNRNADKVYSITASDYRAINLAARVSEPRVEEICLAIERDLVQRVVP